MTNNTIVFLVGKLHVGGAGKMVKYAASIAKEQFEKVIVVSFYESTIDLQGEFGIDFIGLNLSTSEKLWRYDAIRKIRSFIINNNPAVVCAFVSDIAVMVRIATLFLKGMVFVSAERGDPYTLPRIWKILVSWAYSHSDYCLFQLPKARDFFCKKVREKSFVIHNPYLGPLLPPYHGERKKTIVTATRLEIEKGVDILINAFAIIHHKYPDYKLIIYGDGSLKNELHNQVKSLGLVEYVDFLGYQQYIAEKVSKDGIFVLPSRYEGIPNTLIEVMATGMPTISADCSPGGPRFLTRDGELGMLFPVDDTSSLVEKIELLLENKELVRHLEKRSPEILKFTSENVVKPLWIGFFRDISK